MKEPSWCDRTDCLAIHEAMLAQHGGLAGVRDENMLESALAKPRHNFACGKRDLADLAAAYAAGIVPNHPFIDGNKRTGFMTAAAFLEFTATEVDVVLQTLALAAGALDEGSYAKWLRANLRRPRRAKR